MKTRKFNKTKLATSLSLVLGMSSILPAHAADEVSEENIEVISVTGIRGSLIKSMDVKRSSSGVVDSISAEDIGKFPDTNLAESLQRITGVSIDRSNGEGSKVSVRGFGPDYNLITLNGRQMPVTTGTRSFDFANIASESISGVEVHKTSQASDSTGGIGSTINILTHKPLSSPGLKATVGVKAVDDKSTDNGSVTPEVSGLYSNTFADDTFGISLSASYQDRESGNKQAQVGTGWRTFPGTATNASEWGGVANDDTQVNRPGDDDFYSVPQTTVYRFEEQQRTRTNGQLVLQYSPIDTVTASLDYTYMRNDIDTQSNDVSAWFNFVPTENVWSDGPYATPLIYSETYDSPADLSMAAGDYGVRNESGSLGFNIEWQATDNLKLTFDAHNSVAENKPNNIYGSSNNLSTAAFIRTSAATDFSGDLPVLAVGGGNAVTAADMMVTGSVFTNSRNKSEIDQYQFDGEYYLEDAGSIDFGIALTNVNNHSQTVNVQRNDWGGVGSAGDLEDAWFPADTIHDKFDANGGDFSLADGNFDILNTIFMWDFASVRDYAAANYASSVSGDCGNGFCPSTNYAAETDRYTEEKSQAVYVQYNYEDEISGMPYDVHFGLRYEQTDVTSTAAVAGYDGADWIAETEILLSATGEQVFETKTGDYDYVLPSFNFNIEVVEDVMLRAAYSETIGRPSYTDIQGGTVLATLANRTNGGGSAGNPTLLPLESENIDFSAEWYYAPSSYVSVGYFRKDTQNFISVDPVVTTNGIYNPASGDLYKAAVAATGTTEAGAVRDYIFANFADNAAVDVANQTISGSAANNDELLNFNINTPLNSSENSVIDGWEFAAQHFFGESGVGVIANYTLVNSDLALVGISDTANAVLVYENYGFQARVAYNWRDEFLSATSQGTGLFPQYTEAYSQIDLSVSYDIEQVEGLTVFFEGLNITEEYVRVHGLADEQVLNLTETGARYSIGARYTF
ncbi:TonB-dependent receptor [Shewanella ulleungensis]|jgi:TonB-dependent receptor|uniref:TonB-dependent receptor n=1 Tax=Shewanella ulleungensis TaxID=2282699 RepID=A0ABQ2QNE7_9GAMM|nr:TonB-dependent receptor [Shewanella ulleungensis]MCL1151564.1 TonB-dependent receptor [Shewanella ulleungensis]GGP89603.1 TonB-dependent receptor [Shewanella ulleungensis]